MIRYWQGDNFILFFKIHFRATGVSASLVGKDVFVNLNPMSVIPGLV